MNVRFGRPLAVAVVALAVLAAACGNSNTGPSGGASSSGAAFTTIKSGTLTVNVKKTPTLKSVDQLKSGDVIGGQAGTTGRDWIKAHLVPKGIQLKEYTNAPDAFTDLEAGNITGIVNDEPSSRSEVKSRPDLAVVQPIVTKEQYGIALRKQNPDLEKAVNDALKGIIADGTYAR